MEQFLLASHGSLARAMKETAAFLLGTNENVHCLCAYVDEASMNLEQMVGEWAAGRKTEEHWTVITDIFGGSVNNEFMKYAGDPGVNLVAGMSRARWVRMPSGPCLRRSGHPLLTVMI